MEPERGVFLWFKLVAMEADCTVSLFNKDVKSVGRASLDIIP